MTALKDIILILLFYLLRSNSCQEVAGTTSDGTNLSKPNTKRPDFSNIQFIKDSFNKDIDYYFR